MISCLFGKLRTTTEKGVRAFPHLCLCWTSHRELSPALAKELTPPPAQTALAEVSSCISGQWSFLGLQHAVKASRRSLPNLTACRSKGPLKLMRHEKRPKVLEHVCSIVGFEETGGSWLWRRPSNYRSSRRAVDPGAPQWGAQMAMRTSRAQNQLDRACRCPHWSFRRSPLLSMTSSRLPTPSVNLSHSQLLFKHKSPLQSLLPLQD